MIGNRRSRGRNNSGRFFILANNCFLEYTTFQERNYYATGMKSQQYACIYSVCDDA